MLAKLILGIESEVRAIEEDVCSSPPEDYAKFRELVGQRKGLLKAVHIINELLKEANEYD